MTPARCWKVKEAGQAVRLKLATEAPVNGGRNYKNCMDPLPQGGAQCCSYKIWLNAGNSVASRTTRPDFEGSDNV